MKQTALLIIFTISTFFSFSQRQNITVTKKDGTVLNVKSYSNKVKFLKLNFENGKTLELPYNQLNKIEYDYEYKSEIEKVIVEFVRISNRNGSLMEKVVNGKCNLYEGLASYGTGGAVTTYYVKRENELIATKIGSNSFVDLANYKKIALDYFKDCPTVINKIEKKFKRKKAKELVEFYNENCL